MRDLVILGSGRSGTSMVAGTLAASGWWVGDDPYPAREANPKGFFETAEINGINEELLARVLPVGARFEHGQRWLCTLQPGVEPCLDEALRGRIAKLVEHRPFAFKDPRLCYTLPAWEPLLPSQTGRVCVFREPAATGLSILKECRDAAYLASLEMDTERALEVWVCMYERVLAQAQHGDWLFVHYDQMLTRDGLDRLERFAEAPIDRRFPEAGLRHARGSTPAGGRADELYRELCARAEFQPRARVQVGSSESAPELSVILCTYQRRAILEKSIASFEAQDAPLGSFELVVVDDGSSDGTAEWLDAHAFAIPARVLHKPNGGLASARNVGLQAARGRLLLFVNDDTLAFPDLVREHLRAHAELAAGGVEASVLGTFEQPSAHLASALMRHLEHSPEVFRYHDMRSGEFYDHNRFWTCNVSVAAVRVREAGDFDERFKRYGCEDIDLGLRLERLGLRVCYHAGARAHHEHLLGFDSLKRRQLSCSASFVHLFAKHPSELDHPDWSWLAGRGAQSMRAELRSREQRRAQLEGALAALARVELTSLEALGENALAKLALERLGVVLHELNALWWQEGLAQGLDEVGCATFAQLREREPQTAFGGLRRDAFRLEHARAQLELVRSESGGGETVLATLRAIGLGCALRRTAPHEVELRVKVLSDLAVLRHAAGDREAAHAILRRAREVDPRNQLVRENLAALEAAPAAPMPRPAARDALEQARKSAALLRARVLWLGSEPAPERMQAVGARSLVCCQRPEQLAALELEEASLDVVVDGGELARLADPEPVLREVARVLRPGGRCVLSWKPFWWGAESAAGSLPDYAHLLLDERELDWYTTLTLGPARAAELARELARSCRLRESELVRLLHECGFETGGLKAVAPRDPARLPGPALRRELERAHTGASNFTALALEGVLVRRGRTLIIGDLAASAAGD
ncbi:MAG: glycosyltransferase [Planctomycetes bacterium]|nr:glycosyltransferase [Planctomycetota bacterium]